MWSLAADVIKRVIKAACYQTCKVTEDETDGWVI